MSGVVGGMYSKGAPQLSLSKVFFQVIADDIN